MLRLVVTLIIWRAVSLAQETPVEKAWQLAGAGHRDAAVALLNRLVATEPNNVDARLLLGSLLTEAGRPVDAIEQLTAAVRLRPQSAEAQNALGEAYSNLGDQNRALSSFELAVADNPDLAIAQLNLGRALLEAGKFAAAAPHLDLAIKSLGKTLDTANAHYLRAKVFTSQNDPAHAAQELEEALAIHAAFPEAWSDLGEARQNLSQHAGAVEALRRALELAPNDAVAQYRLGQEYMLEHRPALALEPLRTADRLRPNDQSTLNALLKALRETGHTEEAGQVKNRLSQMLAQRETTAQSELQAIQLNDEGAKLQSAGDLHGAMERYAAAVKLCPRNVTMHVNYAIAMLRLGQWTNGLNALHESLLLDPANAKIKAALQDALSQAPAGTVPDWKERNQRGASASPY